MPPRAARVGAVGREPPDPAPVADPREPVAEGDDRAAVAGPARAARRTASGAAGDRRDLAASRRRRAKTDDRPSRSGCGCRLAVNAIRVPSGLQAGSPSGVGPATSEPGLARRGVDEPQVGVAVVDEPGAVELVAEPVDVAVVGQRRLAGLRRRRAGRASSTPPRSSPRASSRRRRASGHRATTRTRWRRAAGRSAGAPRRRRAAAGRPGRSRGGPSPPSAGRAPPRPAAGGRR